MAKRKKDKRTNNDLQNITHTTKDWATRTPLKTGGELRCSGGVGSYYSTSGTRCVILVSNLEISHEWEEDLIVFTTSGVDFLEEKRACKNDHFEFNLGTSSLEARNIRFVIRIWSYIVQESKFTLASLLPNFIHYWLSWSHHFESFTVATMTLLTVT
jgi:hypothetical protein